VIDDNGIPNNTADDRNLTAAILSSAGGSIPPGGSGTTTIQNVEHCVDTTNIVTAICKNLDQNGNETSRTTVKDTNRVHILTIDL
jgi:hypothetical protein